VGFDGQRDRVFAKLESGKNVHGQGLLYTIGGQGNSDQMNIEVAVLKPDVRLKGFRKRKLPDDDAAYLRCGRCDRVSRSGEHFDGARARLASCHMFSKPGKIPPNLIPDGIYTIPEISMAGKRKNS